jgi:hypothetical protein
MSYAAFLGATVFVLQLQEAAPSQRLAIIEKLDIYRRALASGARYTPGIAQSLALVESRAAMVPVASAASGNPLTAESSYTHDVDIPAWAGNESAPQHDPSAALVSEDGSSSFGQPDFQEWLSMSWNHAGFNFFDELAPNL